MIQQTQKIAICGVGNIGSGIDRLAGGTGGILADKGISPVEVKYLVDVRPMDDPRFRQDVQPALDDPEISVVVESIGGVGAAYEITRRALKAGKHVVTPNKQLVAQHGYELQALAAENGVQYRFEAAVGGGIPLITPLIQSLQFNRVTRLMGILNGTTNYILTQMFQDGLSFEDGLKQAQQLGYAEPKPDADVQGIDTANKICILASMAFGHPIKPDQLSITGIQQVTLLDLYQARAKGFAIKLLGVADIDVQGRVNIFVAPCRIPLGHPLALVDGVNNGICVQGHATGELMFYGRGAGMLPTASAVLADVQACLVDSPRPFWQGSWVTGVDSDPWEVLQAQ